MNRSGRGLLSGLAAGHSGARKTRQVEWKGPTPKRAASSKESSVSIVVVILFARARFNPSLAVIHNPVAIALLASPYATELPGSFRAHCSMPVEGTLFSSRIYLVGRGR